MERVCKKCLKELRYRSKGKCTRAKFGGRWPAWVYHDGEEGACCIRHRASNNSHNANLRAPGAYPAWADRRAIEAIYQECAIRRKAGENVEVDHIYPLRGANVSGLHVANNLRIISAKENIRKGNKMPSRMDLESTSKS